MLIDLRFKNYTNQSKKPLLVVITGAGISQESGIKTFRDSNGLWENHDIHEVASPEGWRKNPALVLEFYNIRRKQASEVEPNAGHLGLAALEKDFEVVIITQNVDNLHERAGSTKVLHLHGELSKVRSTKDPSLIYEKGGEPINIGDLCEKGSQLRPHIVWFGEDVPNIYLAANIVAQADVLAVIGTSLVVYPAAGLLEEAKTEAKKWIVDPIIPPLAKQLNFKQIEKSATIGVPILSQELNQYLIDEWQKK